MSKIYFEMSVLPLGAKVLTEDDDQGEMDASFMVTVTLYSLFVAFRKSFFSGEDYESVGKFAVVMTNMFALFPIMQAQGIWLKLLLFVTCFSSLTWHWTEVGMKLPGRSDYVDSYGAMDVCCSVMTIVSYCLQWIPLSPPEHTEIENFWQRNFFGRPRETAEWRCRLTVGLCVNIVLTLTSGIVVYSFRQYTVHVGLGSIAVALLLSLYHLKRGGMTVGKKFRHKFARWATMGILFGASSFLFKSADDELYFHSMWHVYVFSAAYSFSRASEYLSK